MILLDTCILIDVLRGKPQARSFVKSMPAPPAISVVTVTELFAGAKGSVEIRDLRDVLAILRVFDVTEPVAEAAGTLMRSFRASHGLDAVDAIIAATAQAEDMPLATLNLKHFPMFPGLERPY